MKTSKSFLFSVFFALCVLSLFVSCKLDTDSDGDGEVSDFKLLTNYTYNLVSNDSYYVVNEWKCVLIGTYGKCYKKYADIEQCHFERKTAISRLKSKNLLKHCP